MGIKTLIKEMREKAITHHEKPDNAPRADYIALANPANILCLLEYIEKLERVLDAAKDYERFDDDDYGDLAIDRLVETLKALEEK